MDYGWLSLLPPSVAIALAVATRKVITSLGAAVLIGVAIFLAYQPNEDSWNLSKIRQAPWSMVSEHLWIAITEGNPLNPITAFNSALGFEFQKAGDALSALRKSDHLRVFYFTMLFGAMVGILHAGGGMRTLVNRLTLKIDGRFGGQLMVWFAGLLIFFDDYANTLLVGTTMQTPADRLGISREKLAYLVDSTAAPVAGLSLISTWVATEISLMDKGLEGASSNEGSGFELFLETIPFRFYPIFALALVFIIAWTGKDFGPMLESESNLSASAGKHNRDTHTPETNGDAPAWTAFATIAACISMILFVLYDTGSVDNADGLGTIEYWGHYVGNSDAYSALIRGGLFGTLVGLTLATFFAGKPFKHLLAGAMDGAKHLLPAMGVLLFAWTLSRLTKPEFLNTQGYLGGVIENSEFAPMLLPTLVFVLASLVAFSTGTSWGTMGLLVPLAIPTAIASGDGHSLLAATTGAVLAGAIFGDHCSPISDTTVLSSQSTGCEHISHVRTQIPYALLAGVTAILFGTLPAGLGVSPLILLPCGFIAMYVAVFLIGKVAHPLTTAESSAS